MLLFCSTIKPQNRNKKSFHLLLLYIFDHFHIFQRVAGYFRIIIMFIKEVHFSRASVCVPLSVMLLIICHSRDCHLIKSVGTKEMHLFKK